MAISIPPLPRREGRRWERQNKMKKTKEKESQRARKGEEEMEARKGKTD